MAALWTLHDGNLSPDCESHMQEQAGTDSRNFAEGVWSVVGRYCPGEWSSLSCVATQYGVIYTAVGDACLAGATSIVVGTPIQSNTRAKFLKY